MTAFPNILVVTKKLDTVPAGGRELLCKLNYDALKALYGERLKLFELAANRLQGARAYLNAFRGHIDGLNADSISAAMRTIEAENVGKVFVDGSNLGDFVAELKRRHPRVEATVFFHNVEARFFLGSLRLARSMRALAVLAVNYLAERKSVRFSDKIICLSARDSRLLRRLYGRAATHISPMALEDKFPTDLDFSAPRRREEFVLFVGGAFYANRAGISWFVEHVVPRIGIKTCIVGRGFEDIKHELERVGKVEVVGAVDRLAEWYRDARFVIAPIFDGSGMKTKVAEALMYGKKIVGTSEAFSGYEDIVDRAGWSCATADEFVDAISLAQREVVLGFDPQLRALYEEKYSLPAAKGRLAKILGCSSKDS